MCVKSSLVDILCILIIITSTVSSKKNPKFCDLHKKELDPQDNRNECLINSSFDIDNPDSINVNTEYYQNGTVIWHLFLPNLAPNSSVNITIDNRNSVMYPKSDCDKNGSCIVVFVVERANFEAIAEYGTLHDTAEISFKCYKKETPMINITSEGTNDFSFVWDLPSDYLYPSAEISSNCSNIDVSYNDRTVNISNLPYPSQTYQLTFYATSTWKKSMVIQKYITTLPDLPKIVPEILGYSVNDTEIIVHFLKIPEIYHNGKEFEYVISNTTIDEEHILLKVTTKNEVGKCKKEAQQAISLKVEDNKQFQCLIVHQNSTNYLFRWSSTKAHNLHSSLQIFSRNLTDNMDLEPYKYLVESVNVLQSAQYSFLKTSENQLQFGISLYSPKKPVQRISWAADAIEGEINLQKRAVNVNAVNVELNNVTIQFAVYDEERNDVITNSSINTRIHYRRLKDSYYQYTSSVVDEVPDTYFQYTLNNLTACSDYELAVTIEEGVLPECWIRFKTYKLETPNFEVEVFNGSILMKWNQPQCISQKNFYNVYVNQKKVYEVSYSKTQYRIVNLMSNTTYSIALQINLMEEISKNVRTLPSIDRFSLNPGFVIKDNNAYITCERSYENLLYTLKVRENDLLVDEKYKTECDFVYDLECNSNTNIIVIVLEIRILNDNTSIEIFEFKHYCPSSNLVYISLYVILTVVILICVFVILGKILKKVKRGKHHTKIVAILPEGLQLYKDNEELSKSSTDKFNEIQTLPETPLDNYEVADNKVFPKDYESKNLPANNNIKTPNKSLQTIDNTDNFELQKLIKDPKVEQNVSTKENELKKIVKDTTQQPYVMLKEIDMKKIIKNPLEEQYKILKESDMEKITNNPMVEQNRICKENELGKVNQSNGYVPIQAVVSHPLKSQIKPSGSYIPMQAISSSNYIQRRNF